MTAAWGPTTAFAPGERIPPGRVRPPLHHALGPVLVAVAMVLQVVSRDGALRWLAAAVLVAALGNLGVLLVRWWRRAPERLARRRP